MNLFDTSRPRTLSDMPQLAQSVDAVPILYLDPVSQSEVELSAWVRTRDGSGFVSRSHRIHLSVLGEFMSHFIENPEEVLQAHFDWTPHMTRVDKGRDKGDALPRQGRTSDSRDSGTATLVSEDEL